MLLTVFERGIQFLSLSEMRFQFQHCIYLFFDEYWTLDSISVLSDSVRYVVSSIT